MKLYEIAADYAHLLHAVENGDIPEEAIADTLESITAMLDDKVDNIACVIKNLSAEAEAIDAEIKRLQDRKDEKKRRVENLKAYLAKTLLESGYTKVETARNKVSFRKSESVTVANEDDFIRWAKEHATDFLTYKEPTINKTAIKAALKDGEIIDGATIETKQNIQIK